MKYTPGIIGSPEEANATISSLRARVAELEAELTIIRQQTAEAIFSRRRYREALESLAGR